LSWQEFTESQVEYKDYYQVLGVSRDAPQSDIKQAYRKLARKYHPDVSKEPNAEVRFKELGEAYEALKDPENRAAYDQLGANWKAGQDFRAPPGWDQGFGRHGGGGGGFGDAGHSDFFESIFGGGGGGGRPEPESKGEDIHTKMAIDVIDAFEGANRTLTLKTTEVDHEGRPRVKERSLSVKIPKGVRQGQKIRLTGQGDPVKGRGTAGDLFLEIEFRTTPLYQVKGSDIYVSLPVAPWELALGGRVTAPTPTGKIGLKVPPNSAPDSKLRLKGRGIPGSSPGDLYVVLKVALPPATDEAAQARYETMKAEFDFDPRAHLDL